MKNAIKYLYDHPLAQVYTTIIIGLFAFFLQTCLLIALDHAIFGSVMPPGGPGGYEFLFCIVGVCTLLTNTAFLCMSFQSIIEDRGRDY